MPDALPTFRRAEIPPERLFVLPAKLLPDQIDDLIYGPLDPRKVACGPVLIDLINATYIDVSALQCLTALVIRLRSLGVRTLLGVPSHRRARDFLRAWRYPESLARATGASFRELLISDDEQYRGEGQLSFTIGSPNPVGQLEYDPDWQEGRDGRRNFFEFVSFGNRQSGFFSKDPDTIRIAREEGTRWNTSLIREVLRTHLPGESPEDHIARVVIYESISNAVRHPEAALIQAASRFQLTQDDDALGATGARGRAGGQLNRLTGHLRIAIWDDGKSVLETLDPLVRAGKPLRSVRFPAYMYDRIQLEVRDYRSNFGDPVVISESVDPQQADPEEIILLSSFFPGVSRAVAERVSPVEPFPKSERTAVADHEGMGLYALLRTVVAQFRGSIGLRCHRYFLELRPAYDAVMSKTSARYRCRVTRFPAEPFLFRGNLLTMTIPLRAAPVEPIVEPTPTEGQCAL